MNQNTETDDGLTPEEREALAEEEIATLQEDTEGKQTESAPKEAAPVDGERQDATSQESPPKDDAAPAEPAPQPLLVAQAPADAEAKLTEIATKKDALLTQFDDGDITAREYQKQLDELSKQERRIEFEVHEAQLAQKLEQQRLQNEWTATCNAFVQTHAIYQNNPRLYKALDAEVRDLASKPETASWSGQRFLDEAHKNLKAAFGLQDGESVKATSKQQVRELPPNLARVPAADVEDTNGNRYAVLDRMANTDPIGYEEALSKMSESERNRYLAS